MISENKIVEESVQFKKPESILVVIYTRQGQFLLMERAHPHGFWQSVTGSLEWDEQAIDTARREVYEETGLVAGFSLKDLQHVETFPIIHPWKKRYAPGEFFNCENWYALQLSSTRTIRLNASEHRQYRWLNLPQALARVSSWTNRKAILQVAKQNGFVTV